MKTIYEFEIKTEKEVDKTETREENGQTITVTSKVKESVPTLFAIKRPSSMEKEEGEILRAAHFGECVDKGLITQAQLRKKYGDRGGVYTQEEEKTYRLLHEELRKCLDDYERFASSSDEAEKAKAKEAFEKLFVLRREIVAFENTSELFYKDTAETKARNRLIEYFVYQLTYWKQKAEDEWKPFFKGENFDEKRKNAFEMEDSEQEFYWEIKNRVGFILALILASPNLTKEEIKQIEDEA